MILCLRCTASAKASLPDFTAHPAATHLPRCSASRSISTTFIPSSSMSQILIIASRKSPLALWQAEYVRDRLLAAHPGLHVELVRMSTQGDKILDSPLAKIGGKGRCVKELEDGLLGGRADIAVHAMKDVPGELPAGLHLPVICEREDPRDAYVSNAYPSFDALPHGARVGTSSLRRQCQRKKGAPAGRGKEGGGGG